MKWCFSNGEALASTVLPGLTCLRRQEEQASSTRWLGLPLIDQHLSVRPVPGASDLFMQSFRCPVAAERELTFGGFQTAGMYLAQAVCIEESTGTFGLSGRFAAFATGEGGRQQIDRFILI